MAGEVDICNAAFRKLGAADIVSLSDDTVEGRLANSSYDDIRRQEFRRHIWSCLIERTTLAADSPVPAWGRANSFTLPANYLRLAPRYPEDNAAVDWQIEGRKLLSDDDSLQIRFIADIEDVNRWDVLLREAVSCKLALEWAEKLTQSNTKKDALTSDYRYAISEARKTNAIEKPVADEAVEDEWLSCRW